MNCSNENITTKYLKKYEKYIINMISNNNETQYNSKYITYLAEYYSFKKEIYKIYDNDILFKILNLFNTNFNNDHTPNPNNDSSNLNSNNDSSNLNSNNDCCNLNSNNDCYNLNSNNDLNNIYKSNWLKQNNILLEISYNYYRINDYNNCLIYCNKLLDNKYLDINSILDPIYILGIFKALDSYSNYIEKAEQYLVKLSNMFKTDNICNSLIEFYILINNFKSAHDKYYEFKSQINLTPIDLTLSNYPPIYNQVIYDVYNIFKKDNITNNYINKIKNILFNKIDICDICSTENILLIPFECTHFVCAQNCYVKIISDTKKKCPFCNTPL